MLKHPDLPLRCWDFPCYFLTFSSELLILEWGSGRVSQVNARGCVHPHHSSREYSISVYKGYLNAQCHHLPTTEQRVFSHQQIHLFLPIIASKMLLITYNLSISQALQSTFLPGNLRYWPQAFSQAPSLTKLSNGCTVWPRSPKIWAGEATKGILLKETSLLGEWIPLCDG